jgi:hypothetical protein
MSLAPFEVLHRFFVILRRRAGLERAEISALPCRWVLLPGIQPVVGFNLSDHDWVLFVGNTMPVLPSRVSIVNVFKSQGCDESALPQSLGEAHQ